MADPSPILDRNLRALARTSPGAVRAIAATPARDGLTWGQSPAGLRTAKLDEPGPRGAFAGRALCSKRDPDGEARALTDPVNVTEHPVVVVCGFGLGYHIGALCRRMGRSGLVVVFEPDVGLLRAAMETIDCAAWLEAGNLILITDPDDEAAMAEAVRGFDPMLAMGVHLLDHPPSAARLGEARGRFVERFTGLLRAVRMNVLTTMVQTEATLRNLTQNIDHYALGEGIDGLQGACAGKPALLIAAGPSLAGALDLLGAPGLRDRFVIIAVQTVLKTLLSRGIRPHFVTALDFHEISRRFYEGLTARDVEGVTLVVEPKVNPVVPASWPGALRCAADGFLDELLGDRLARPMGRVTPGATVAHLSYYLARHLGCDPVALVGQDLGFTGGQYYADRAAIHDTWAPELNEFKTLEMFEWERIVRMRPQLTKKQDTLGRTVYTDEQMHTYLVQFQRAFKADAERGLRTIDATVNGCAGVRKQHTETMELGEVLSRLGATGVERALASAMGLSTGGEGRALRERAVRERLTALRQDTRHIAAESRRTAGLLRQMLTQQEDQRRVNGLIARVEAIRDDVTARQPAFGLVERLNQTGAFNRTRADRRIYIEGDKDPLAVQRAQIERDITNVSWLADAADVMSEILEGALGALRGGPKRTRDPLPQTTDAKAAPTPTVWALITDRGAHTGLGLARARHAAWMGAPLIAHTVARLARCERLAGIAVLTADVEGARRAVGPLARGVAVRFIHAPAWTGAPAHALRAARAFAPHCWRAGLAGWTVYDEALDAPAMSAACAELGATGALVVGDDWALVDPALCDALVARHAESPLAHRVTFCQAAPGLAGIVLSRASLEDIARSREAAGVHACVGGLLGYMPTNPKMDPIARSHCVGVAPAVRDAVIRCIPDTAARAAFIERALLSAGRSVEHATAADVAGALSEHATAARPGAPSLIAWTLDDGALDARLPALEGAAVTISAGTRDMDDIETAAARVREAAGAHGCALHVRVDLDRDERDVDALLALAPDVISVDVHGDSAASYEAVTGRGAAAFARSRANLERLVRSRRNIDADLRPTGWAAATPWVAARLTRRDEVFEEIDAWYDRWTVITGHAVIDPLGAPLPGARIAPLTAPRLARVRAALDTAAIGMPGVPGAPRPLAEAHA